MKFILELAADRVIELAKMKMKDGTMSVQDFKETRTVLKKLFNMMKDVA
jgi:hypothetical protein